MHDPDLTEQRALHAEVAEANRQIYAQLSSDYEDCVFTGASRRRLQHLLSAAVQHVLGKTEDRRITALDACGGTGNAARILSDLGCEVTLVDVSASMVGIYQKSAVDDQDTCAIVEDIQVFLTDNPRSWDLITFSSALHHLRHPEDILRLALDHLSDGGLVLTVADPSPAVSGLSFRTISTFDRIVYGLRKRPLATLASIARRLRRRPSGRASTPASAGRLAECHARTGIDDLRLRQAILKHGFHVLRHDQYAGGYNGVVRLLYRALRFKTSFSMVASNAPEPFYLPPHP